MTMEIADAGFPCIAASQITPVSVASTTNPVAVPVALTTGGERRVIPVGSQAQRPFGMVRAAASQGKAVTVYPAGKTVRAVSAASIAAGDEVAIASTNGAFGVAAGASGVTRWATGQALQAANAGETFALYINPRQISNLI